jgi:glycine/D-amino acid oxidase-like deaminating enzyme/nitrite reductase/ring-hydroxylating ferredoxin subunit
LKNNLKQIYQGAFFAMKSDEGQSVSIWEATGEIQEPGSLNTDLQTDVCIVGAGISGLTTAYMLAKAGRKVVVVDDGIITGGETCRTTAHLSNAIDDRYYELEKLHGEEKSRLAAESHTAAIDKIEEISRLEGIDCDFSRVNGFLFPAPDGKDDLNEELKAAHRAGLTAVEQIESAPLPGFETGATLRFPNQGQFHVIKYLAGLVQVIQTNGGQVFSQTKVIDWTGGDDPEVELLSGNRIRANSLVLATNYPLKSGVHVKQAAYRTYVVGLKIPKGSVEKALFWDTEEMYHYVRIQEEADYDVLISGGEDHRVGQADDFEQRYERLEQWTREHFPVAGETLFRWSGEVQESGDYLAYIGRWSVGEPNVYMVTGDSGMGMTHGTIAGMLISDLILARENPWTELYNPSRVFTQSLTETATELSTTFAQYKDWITKGDVETVEDLKPGQGAVISKGLQKIAAYRDEQGALHQRSAVCPHMHCIVSWNGSEKSWDCPCHGSRFGIDGHVINPPAIAPLAEISE